jgi:hypothetical protein
MFDHSAQVSQSASGGHDHLQCFQVVASLLISLNAVARTPCLCIIDVWLWSFARMEIIKPDHEMGQILNYFEHKMY